MTASAEGAARRFALRYREFVSVAENGLPRPRVFVAFLILLAVVGAVLISLSINGTSSGAYFSAVHSGKDPQLLSGKPELIRSDEWNVGVPWTISQVQQGLPARNASVPGGADADLPFALPDRQPATIMAPQNWGFLFLDVGRAYAWRWWISALSLILSAFALVLTLLPRRPLMAAGLAVGFFFSPFFQWWFEPSTQWPVAWGLLTCAALVWALKPVSLRSRIVWAILVAYLTAVMAIGVYAPFIVPLVYVVLFFGIGQVIREKRSGMPWRTLALRLIPIAVAGLVGTAALAIWLHSKAAVVAAFLGTVYPGQRLTSTGERDYLSVARTFGATFSESLERAGGFLGINSSEASSFFLLGVFLLPLGVWIAIRRGRRGDRLPWTTISMLGFLALVLAFILVPGWDPIAHLLFLDLSNGTRMRIGIGLASFVLIGSVARDVDEEPGEAPRLLVWGTVGGFLLIQLALAAAIFHVLGSGRLWSGSPLWPAYAALSAAAIYLFLRRRFLWGTAIFLVVSIASSAAVNPVYVGVFDLRNTAVSRAIVKVNSASPKQWVGVGGVLDSALLLESGVTAFNGTQGAPSKTMWREVDPGSHFVEEWNRLGAVVWAPGKGEPVISNPAQDVISASFDACSTFAQRHIGYVLSTTNLSSPCLAEVSSFPLPHGTHATIYKTIVRP